MQIKTVCLTIFLSLILVLIRQPVHGQSPPTPDPPSWVGVGKQCFGTLSPGAKVRVEYENTNNAVGFYFYRNTSSDPAGATLMATRMATSGARTGTGRKKITVSIPYGHFNTRYYYWGSSFNAGGESERVSAGSHWSDLSPLRGGSTNSETDSSIVYTWEAVPGAHEYIIMDHFGDPPVPGFSTRVSTNSFTRVGLMADTNYELKVIAWNLRSNGACSNSLVLNGTTLPGPPLTIRNTDGLPETFALQQNYPNPFNPTTTISYQLPKAENVRITIFDLAGRRVRDLINETKAPGSYTAQWDGKNQLGGQVASGLYIYQIQAGQFTQSRKMLFMK